MYSGGMNLVSAASTSKSFDYVCLAETSIAGDIDINMKVTPTVSIPEAVAPNGNLAVKDVVADIQIDLTGNLDDLRALINPFNGHVNHFNIEVNGESKNAVGGGGVPIPETDHEPGDDFIPFTVGGVDTTFSVGDENVDITVGEIEAVINAKLGPTPIDLVVTCIPPADNVLATVEIDEDADPGEPGDDDDENDENGDDDNGKQDDDDNGKSGDDDNDKLGDDKNGNGDDNDKPGDDGKKSDNGDVGGKLPETATNNPLFMLMGSLITVAGGALIFVRRKVLN